MSTAAHPVWHLLIAPWQQLDPARNWVRRVVYTLLAVALLGLLWLAPGHARRIVLTLLACVALGALYVWQMSSLLAQNQPALARLVPGHLARLRLAACLLWAASSLLTAGLLAVGIPELSLPLAWLAATAFNAFVVWALRHWTLWLWIWVAPLLIDLAGLKPGLRAAAAPLVNLWLAHPWSTTLAAIAVMGLLQARLFGEGGTAHQRRYRREQAMREIVRASARGDKPGLAAYGAWGERLSRPFDRGMAWWLNRALQQARTSEASVMARAEFVLHGPQHWLRQTMGFVLALTVFVALPLLVLISSGMVPTALLLHAQPENISFGMAIGLTCSALGTSLTLPAALWHSRREQSLLRLLPGMPQGQRLNRAVLRLQLRHAGLAWLLGALPVAALGGLWAQPHVMAMSFVALPIGCAFLLRSPARSHQIGLGWPMLLSVVLGVGCMGLWLTTRWPIWPLVLACSLLTAAITAWRLPRVLGAPMALPAGRLA